MIKSSPNIYEQSSPPSLTSSAMMSTTTTTTTPHYPTHDFLRSTAMHFDYGSMNSFWPTHSYDTNNNNTHGYYQQHLPNIHS